MDVFVRDRDPDGNGIFDEGNGVTTRVSVDSNGGEGDSHSYWPSLSADGRFVAFESVADDLVVKPANGIFDVHLHERASGRTIDLSSGCPGPTGDGNSNGFAISADGSHVAFSSVADNLVSGDTNLSEDVYVVDRAKERAHWSNYDAGLAGTLGVPGFTARADPVLGTTLTLDLENSRGVATAVFLFLGLGRVSIPTGKGGTLLVDALVALPLALPAGDLPLSGSLPEDPALCGAALDLQAIEADPGAAQDAARVSRSRRRAARGRLARIPTAMTSALRIPLGSTGLSVFPLCLGGNVFGWTADESLSGTVLDAYARAGGNFVDTADAYSAWAPGNLGGESETILGRWMAARGCRDQIVVATKVGKLAAFRGLRASTIATACDASLQRLRTDRIDLYYAHADDAETPLAETVGAFDALVRAGKVRAVAASNYAPARLAEALAIATRDGLARFAVVQDHYHLVKRDLYEGTLESLCTRERLAFLPYYALAQGFLTGKYRTAAAVAGGAATSSPRASGALHYLDARGLRVLAVLDELAASHSTTVAAVALAWLRARPNVVAPIASARTPAQLAELLPMATISLTREQVTRLTDASR
jgi:aryl-alcohol dehydrogenase (NADP+)